MFTLVVNNGETLFSIQYGIGILNIPSNFLYFGPLLLKV